MNKIMKAVNELRGEYGSEHRAIYKISMGMYAYFDHEHYDFSGEFICTKTDFNDLVSQLETNFGKSCTRQEWLTTRDKYGTPNGIADSNFISSAINKVLNKIKEDQANTVYTQEFKQRGGDNEIWKSCKIIFTGNKHIVLVDDNGREYSRKKSRITIRDIDTRTDKEKAVHDILKAATSLPTWTDKSKAVVNAIKDGKIHGVKWVGE